MADGPTDLRVVRETAEYLQYELFQWLVQTLCLGDWTWMGNAKRAELLFQSLVEEGGMSVPSRLLDLTELLGTRGRAWTHGSGGFSEGVHGWLTPAETAEAADLLGPLPLPDAPDDVREAREWSPAARTAVPDDEPYYLQDDRVRAACLRTVARAAAMGGQGILWGNDCYPPPHRPWTPPAEPDKRSATATDLARSMRASGRYDYLPVLADALEDGGVDDPFILAHCRDAAGHDDACWVVDWVLGATVGGGWE